MRIRVSSRSEGDIAVSKLASVSIRAYTSCNTDRTMNLN